MPWTAGFAVILKARTAPMTVGNSRGTVDAETVTIEQVPLSWFNADGDRGPEPGDLVRIVSGRLAHPVDPIRVKADRTMTAIWRVADAGHDAPSELAGSVDASARATPPEADTGTSRDDA
jgi:hypothetical protein